LGGTATVLGVQKKKDKRDSGWAGPTRVDRGGGGSRWKVGVERGSPPEI